MPSFSNWLLLTTPCGDKMYQVAEEECSVAVIPNRAAAAAAAAAAVLRGCLPLCLAARWSVVCLLSHPAQA